MVLRQVGKVAKSRPGLTVVRWEDGTREKVDLLVFDEAFAHFRVGQPFEAVVTRNPVSFRIIRAAAVRKLPNQDLSEEWSKATWDSAAIGEAVRKAADQAEEINEGFWLQPPPR